MAVAVETWDVPDAVAHRSGWLLDQVLEAPRTPALVARYFAGEAAGATFDLLEPGPPHALAAADLLAAGLVAGPLEAPAVRALLDPALGRRLAPLLRAVPEQAELWSARPTALDAAAGADALLREVVGPLAAAALLARKRPRLVPVLDDATTALLELPPGRALAALRAVLQDAGRRDRAERLRPPGLDDAVPTLRLVEVAAWAAASAGRRARTGGAR